MAVVFANAYTDAISDNVRSSNHNKRINGTIQKDSPLGYINEARNRTTNPEPIVVIDKQRAPFVIKAFEMYVSGCYSINEITKTLNKEGLTQKKVNLKASLLLITSLIICLLQGFITEKMNLINIT